MVKSSMYRLSAVLIVVAVTGSLLAAQERRRAPVDRFDSADSLGGSYESGITKPYEERKLQFGGVGLVTEVKVKVGDPVEAGQVLAQLDTSVELAERRPLEIESKSMVQEEYALADKGVKEQEYLRKQELFKTRNASKSEVEEARLAVERAKASVQLAIQERQVADARIAAIDSRIALKTLKSPVSGFVQSIETGVGEVGGIDQQKYAMVVVQNDPLKVDVNIPVRDARRLKVGQALKVRYIDEDDAPWQPARIIVMKPVADRGSQTRGIELELKNDTKKPAGLRVQVMLPEDVATVER